MFGKYTAAGQISASKSTVIVGNRLCRALCFARSGTVLTNSFTDRCQTCQVMCCKVIRF